MIKNGENTLEQNKNENRERNFFFETKRSLLPIWQYCYGCKVTKIKLINSNCLVKELSSQIFGEQRDGLAVSTYFLYWKVCCVVRNAYIWMGIFFLKRWECFLEYRVQLTESFGNFSCAACIISRPSFLWLFSTKLRYDSLYFSAPKSPFSKIVSILWESPVVASTGSFLPKSIKLDGNLQAELNTSKIITVFFNSYIYAVSNVGRNNCILGCFQKNRFSNLYSLKILKFLKF